MHSSTSNSNYDLNVAPVRRPDFRDEAPQRAAENDHDFVREVPNVPWKGVVAAVAVLALAATVAWEVNARRAGYAPSLNDTPDLWVQQREKVQPDSMVLVGTSRMLFDADLDVLEQGFGKRPIQLALAGSSPYPVLADLANDESFHGTVILDIVSPMFLAPAGSPPMKVSGRALGRAKDWNYSQKWGHELGMVLEENVAFLKQEDLTLEQLLKRLPIPNRAHAQVGPPLPPYFYTVDRDRRGRMFDPAAVVGTPLQQRVALGWIPLFTMPPPPSFIPAEKFGEIMHAAVEQRFKDTSAQINKLRARGVKIVFVRLPVNEPLIEREEKMIPLAAGWGRLVAENKVPAINFADHPDLNSFDCPEWSHLSAADSIEFTKRLVPHLQRALAQPGATATAAVHLPLKKTPSS